MKSGQKWLSLVPGGESSVTPKSVAERIVDFKVERAIERLLSKTNLFQFCPQTKQRNVMFRAANLKDTLFERSF